MTVQDYLARELEHLRTANRAFKAADDARYFGYDDEYEDQVAVAHEAMTSATHCAETVLDLISQQKGETE